jgi:hypothetical protein
MRLDVQLPLHLTLHLCAHACCSPVLVQSGEEGEGGGEEVQDRPCYGRSIKNKRGFLRCSLGALEAEMASKFALCQSPLLAHDSTKQY